MRGVIFDELLFTIAPVIFAKIKVISISTQSTPWHETYKKIILKFRTVSKVMCPTSEEPSGNTSEGGLDHTYYARDM